MAGMCNVRVNAKNSLISRDIIDKDSKIKSLTKFKAAVDGMSAFAVKRYKVSTGEIYTIKTVGGLNYAEENTVLFDEIQAAKNKETVVAPAAFVAPVVNTSINPVDPFDENFNYAEDIVKSNKSAAIKVVETPTESYYEKFGKKYDRLTNFVGNNISNYKSKNLNSGKSSEESVADEKFKFKNKSTDTVVYKEVEYTYDQLVLKFGEEFKTARYKGKIIHAIIEKYILKKNKEDTSVVDNNLNTFYSESGMLPNEFNYLKDSYIENVIKNKLNFNTEGAFKDMISPELTLLSDVFDIGTTIDGFIQHADGTVSIIDYKTGAAFLGNEEENFNFIDYGIRADLEVKDTKLGRAKLELALRAMILKELYPDIKFRDLKIVYLDTRPENIKSFDISLSGYVGFFEDYFKNVPIKLENKAKKEKDTATKADLLNKAKFFSDIHKKAEAKNLFVQNSYIGRSKLVFENSEISELINNNMPIDQQIQIIGSKLAEYQALLDFYPSMKTESPTEYINLKKRRDDLAKTLTELQSGASDIFKKSSNFEDLGWFKKNLGNLYSISNPLVQQVIKNIREGMDKITRRVTIKKNKLGFVTKKLVDEWYVKNGKNNFGGQNLGLNYKSLWGFMHEERTEIQGYEEDGTPKRVKSWYKKNYTADDVKNDTITATEFEFYTLIQEMIEEMAISLEKLTIYAKDKDNNLILISRAEHEGIDMAHFRKNWMPRIYKTEAEFYQENSIKDYTAYKFKAYINDFLIDDSQNPNPHLIPLKYQDNVEYAKLAQDDKLSVRWENMIMQAYNNVLNVGEMGSAFAYSKTVQDLLLTDSTMLNSHGNTKFKQTAEWLNGFTKLQLVADKDLTQYRSGRHYVSKTILKKIFGEERYKKLNLDTIFDKLNNFTTMSTMWFKPISGGFNMLLNVLMTSQRATTNTLAKYGFGLKGNEFDEKEFYKANEQYFKSRSFAAALKNLKSDSKDESTKDKVQFFLEYFGFDSNKFSYIVTQNDLNDTKLKILSSGLPFVFHQIGEEYSQVTLLLAQLNAMKTKDKNGKEISMYDAFEYDDNIKSYKYTGGIRFKTEDGRQIGEPSFEENTRMKRTYERIHGGYKSEEKMLIEGVALGRWVVKFRKYIPSQVLDNFQSEYEDWSIGGWGNTVDKNGNPIFLPGEDTVKWMARNNEGRVIMFTKWLAYSLGLLKGDPKYQWQNLSDYKKTQVVSMFVNVAYAFGIIAATAMLFGGEDPDKLKNNSTYRRFTRLKEDMMPLHPFAMFTAAAGVQYGTNPVGDILRTLSSPLIQPKQIYDLSSATWTFFFNGVINGETLQSGKNKGELAGTTQLMKGLPLLSSVNQWLTTSQDFKDFKGGIVTEEESQWLDNARPGR